MCSELFLRVAELCEIFAYRTWHTPSVANCFFGSLSYVRSSLSEQGTRGVYWVVSSGLLVMSDLRLQNKAHAVCGELFFRVAQLCLIFAYRARRTACIVSCFFGPLSYVWFSLIKRGTDRVYWVVFTGRSVMSALRLKNEAYTVCIELFLWVNQLCLTFAYRIRHTPCVLSCFFRSLCYVRSSLIEQGKRRV